MRWERASHQIPGCKESILNTCSLNSVNRMYSLSINASPLEGTYPAHLPHRAKSFIKDERPEAAAADKIIECEWPDHQVRPFSKMKNQGHLKVLISTQDSEHEIERLLTPIWCITPRSVLHYLASPFSKTKLKNVSSDLLSTIAIPRTFVVSCPGAI